MRKGFIDIAVAILVGAIFIGSLSFLGLSFNQHQENLGATVLQTQLSDTLGTFRTNVNTSITNLNSDKIETISGTSPTSSLTLTAGTKISIATSSNALTITNIGVQTLTAGTNITVTSATGTPTVAVSSTPVFSGLVFINGGLQIVSAVTSTGALVQSGTTTLSGTNTFSGKNILSGTTTVSAASTTFSGATSFNATTTFSGSVVGMKVTYGTFSKDASDANGEGTTTIVHGLGVKPQFIRIMSYGAAGNHTMTSYGVSNGTTYANTYVLETTNGAAVAAGNTTSSLVVINDYTSARYQTATISTINSTNIILTWAKTGTPGGVNYATWEAYSYGN